MGPMLDAKFADRYEEFLDWIQPHHRPQARHRPDHAPTTRGTGSSASPATGCSTTPWWSTASARATGCSRRRPSARSSASTTYRSLAEAIELANAPGYGLSSAIYTTDPQEAFAFRDGIGAGMVSINNSTSGAEAHLPFGGNGKSGNGSRQSGIWVLDQFTRWQSVNWDYSGRLQKAQMDIVELDRRTPTFRLDADSPMPAEPDAPPSTRPSTRTCAQALADLSDSAIALSDARHLTTRSRRGGGGCSRRRLTSRHLDCAARRAAAPGARVLHDRLGRARGQRAGGAGAATDRPGAAALPVGRLLRGPGPAGARLDAGPRRPAGPAGAGRRADRRRPAQGVRASGPGDHPADVDDRLPPAARGRAGAVALHRAHRLGVDSRVAAPTPSWSARSATRRPTTRPRSGRSTPRSTRPSAGCRCRSCSSARTTVWASRCRRRPAGSSPRTAPAPA